MAASERTSLEAHVDLCAERYKALEDKLDQYGRKYHSYTHETIGISCGGCIKKQRTIDFHWHSIWRSIIVGFNNGHSTIYFKIKMKIVELVNKIRLPITNEEADVLGKFDENKKIAKEDLTPRQSLIANQLVNKDILFRKNEDGKIYYRKKI
jgi:hypothetical protein